MLEGATSGGGLLDQIVASLTAMPAEQRAEVEKTTLWGASQLTVSGRPPKWIPHVGPQTDAYFSQADCLLYGGEPGGGKSQLLLGLAFNAHRRSLIMRREYGDLERLIDDALKIHGSRDGFNGSPPPRLRISEDQIINFRAAQRVGDEQGTMGQGRDFLGIDEATHFHESQVRFLMGWVRSEVPGQRCRTVLATNPPLQAHGLWVIKMFAPWLDPKFPFPAKTGELRWALTNENGEDEWVSGPNDTRTVMGREVRPMSRTYIPASVRDNPDYMANGYETTLMNMDDQRRKLLMGGFRTTFEDDEGQIIPTEWIIAAQGRWKETPPANVPMCTMAVDCSGGGKDPMVIAARHDGWFAPLIVIPGKDIPRERLGSHAAGLVIQNRYDNALVIVDMGGGYGGPVYEHLVKNIGRDYVQPYKGAAVGQGRSLDRQYSFFNMRSKALWQFREALRPDQRGGSSIALPPDEELVADLAAPVADLEYMAKGIVKAESKEDVCNRLGRSTDKGDAVMMAWTTGLKTHQVKGGFRPAQRPQVVMGHMAARRPVQTQPQSYRRREHD